MTLPRLIPICTVTMLSVTAMAGQDAAQEVQEGNVKQWMEYYERERRQADEPHASKEAGTESSRQTSDDKAQVGDIQTPEKAITGPNE